ncbi:2-phospho-L-lactate transferase CofD family protein [Nocardia sp. SC052]|uniref:2-phospho-L-lactate transferase CofD family protein n=1 Tax=Nocardia sichangensis TaxID=3385975 RepID=UPI00399F6317
MSRTRIAVLSGGLGGARLALALQAAGLERSTCFITNVGDDLWLNGFPVCPDTDSVLYALAGCFDEERGWGVLGDVFDDTPHTEWPWFRIGQRDAKQHQRRGSMLLSGKTCSEATAALGGLLGVTARVHPATNDRLETRIRIGTEWLSFQEWLVRDRARNGVEEVLYVGAAGAVPSPGVVEALSTAETVVLAASSPIASLAPILAIPGIADVLRARHNSVIAISPLVARRPPDSERDVHRWQARAALLAAFGLEPTPVSVAGWLSALGVAATFVLDPADSEDRMAVESLGLQVVVAPTIGSDAVDRAKLIAAIASAVRVV